MMRLRRNVYYIGVNDRTSSYFESLWPLPYGVSYNAYLIDDEKVALIDTVEVGFFSEFLENIRYTIGDRPIDYLVINHMEPDHSGSIALIKEFYPDITIVGNKKTFDMVKGFYNVGQDPGIIVDDKTTLSLGRQTLSFRLIPMVHWPETMVTYLDSEKVLFSGDAFGCFGAINGGPIDVDMDYDTYIPEMVRYYACVLGKYGVTVQAALKKLASFDIAMICSTHGPMWTKYVPDVFELYKNLSAGKLKKGLVVIYGSMYGNSQQVAEALMQGASDAGVKSIRVHPVNTADPSQMLTDVFTYNGLALGGPTYNAKLYPPLDDFIQKLLGREIKNHHYAIFGGFSWAGKSLSILQEYVDRLHGEVGEGKLEWRQGVRASTKDSAYKIGMELGKRLLADENAY